MPGRWPRPKHHHPRQRRIIHIHNQHGRAILHQRTRADVFDLAQPGVQRLHNQFAFAEKFVHNQSVTMRALTEDHNRKFRGDRSGPVVSEKLMPGKQPDLLATESEMRTACQYRDCLPLEFQCLVEGERR